ncbi:uncharacterized protein LOC143561770 [Bidens hawaiensis]|uniref:uncharacterized protein LOC143561770 n=1 Tax=Bidens hawaiensis TaxID=980011 RepID=UPI00404970DF
MSRVRSFRFLSTQSYHAEAATVTGEAGHERLLADYLDNNPVYDEKMFKRRFRLIKELFKKIANDLEAYHSFFRQSMDARGRRGLTTYQKCTAALRQMGYGTTSDAWDEYLRMSERTTLESMCKFCKCAIEIYGNKYLRKPNLNDIQQLYEAHESKHGFPGMLGSLDCMQWAWFNYRTAWRGQYMRGDHRHPTWLWKQ